MQDEILFAHNADWQPSGAFVARHSGGLAARTSQWAAAATSTSISHHQHKRQSTPTIRPDGSARATISSDIPAAATGWISTASNQSIDLTTTAATIGHCGGSGGGGQRQDVAGGPTAGGLVVTIGPFQVAQKYRRDVQEALHRKQTLETIQWGLPFYVFVLNLLVFVAILH